MEAKQAGHGYITIPLEDLQGLIEQNVKKIRINEGMIKDVPYNGHYRVY